MFVCDGVYEFVSCVLGVRMVLVGVEFSFDGTFAMYGVMWKIVLWDLDVELYFVKCFDRFVLIFDDEVSVYVLRDGLLLIRVSERAVKASGR